MDLLVCVGRGDCLASRGEKDFRGHSADMKRASVPARAGAFGTRSSVFLVGGLPHTYSSLSARERVIFLIILYFSQRINTDDYGAFVRIIQ